MQELSINKKLKIIALHLKGFSYNEISAKTGVSKGTRSQHYRYFKSRAIF